MDLNHSFVVPASVEQTWAAFADLGQIAECFPGADVTRVEGDEFDGTVKVKLGPIALVYSGTGRFVERDEAAHRMVIDAKGKDKRGNGTAGAKVTATMVEQEDRQTAVTVATDLSITGKPAQFGRGVIQDVSDKLLQQFVSCLESKVAPPPAPPAASTAAEEPAAGGTVAPPGVAAGPTPPTGAPAAGPPRPAPPQDDAINLGATVLPVLAKTYWKQAVAAVVVLLVVWRVLRRR